MSGAEPIPADVVLAARGLTKRYGPVTAMVGADVDVRKGEILAVVGDNGAGKSTLIKSLTGVVSPDEGAIYLDGVERRVTPTAVERLGIGVVYQDLALAGDLSLVRNLFLGREPRRPGLRGAILRQLDEGRMTRIAQEGLARLGLADVSLRSPVSRLSGGQRQAVAIARGVIFGARILILDEPTAALGVRESAMVEEVIRAMRSAGVTVVLISHDFPQAFRLADRIHVHRRGARVALLHAEETTMQEVVGLMTGAARHLGGRREAGG